MLIFTPHLLDIDLGLSLPHQRNQLFKLDPRVQELLLVKIHFAVVFEPFLFDDKLDELHHILFRVTAFVINFRLRDRHRWHVGANFIDWVEQQVRRIAVVFLVIEYSAPALFRWLAIRLYAARFHLLV